MPRQEKVYHFWNGKNIDGRSVAGFPDLLEEGTRNSSSAEMKYEVGVDTIAADDLQPGMEYDE